ncbi:MAG: PEP-CTERM sorting domain-containing protein [Bryobacteraceae bacterium]
MHWTNSFQARLLLCGVIAVQVAGATTIIESTGNSGGAVPLGFYAPYNSAEVAAVGWTQTSSYTNVVVTASLLTPTSGGTIDYTLVKAIGPGTSFAVDGITQGSVNLPYVYGNVDLFQLPSLGPGTYYLVLDSPTPNLAWLYNFPYQATYTMDAGVSLIGNYSVLAPGIDTSFTPASSLVGENIATEFNVTATPANAPEPGTFGFLGLALVGVSIVLRRMSRVAGGG